MATGYQRTEPSSKFCEILQIGRRDGQRQPINPHEVTIFYKYKSRREGGKLSAHVCACMYVCMYTCIFTRSFYTESIYTISPIHFARVWSPRRDYIWFGIERTTTKTNDCYVQRAHISHQPWSRRRYVRLLLFVIEYNQSVANTSCLLWSVQVYGQFSRGILGNIPACGLIMIR